MSQQYLVTKIAGCWHVCWTDVVMGPYISMSAAETAAIRSAKQDFRFGLAARVTVEDDGTKVIYDNQTLPSDHREE